MLNVQLHQYTHWRNNTVAKFSKSAGQARPGRAARLRPDLCSSVICKRHRECMTVRRRNYSLQFRSSAASEHCAKPSQRLAGLRRLPSGHVYIADNNTTNTALICTRHLEHTHTHTQQWHTYWHTYMNSCAFMTTGLFLSF